MVCNIYIANRLQNYCFFFEYARVKCIFLHFLFIFSKFVIIFSCLYKKIHPLKVEQKQAKNDLTDLLFQERESDRIQERI